GRGQRIGGSVLGSLRDALAAAGREDTGRRGDIPSVSEMKDVTNALPPPSQVGEIVGSDVEAATAEASDAALPPPIPQDTATTVLKTAVEAARDARGGTPNIPSVDATLAGDDPVTTGVVNGGPAAAPAARSRETQESSQVQTQFVRGKQQVSRNNFAQDPVVAWLVIVGGPGLGAFRPVFEGNNSIGRGPSNRIPVDFGDESISNEEQAYVRYDSTDRSFLLVPNLSKTNVVSVNNDRPAQPVPLNAMDLITMGRTQLVFVPFCGPEFDWGELSELNKA
ncbi:MAG: FHA domain-containing protein, partial [Pseudomonadota bacterium]